MHQVNLKVLASPGAILTSDEVWPPWSRPTKHGVISGTQKSTSLTNYTFSIDYPIFIWHNVYDQTPIIKQLFLNVCIFHLKSRCERWYGNIIVWLWRTNSRRWRPQWQARSRLYALYVLLFFFFYNSGAWNNSNTIRPFSVIWIIGKEIYVNLRIQILCFQVTHTHSVVYLCGEARSSVHMIWSQCVLHWSETCSKKKQKTKKTWVVQQLQ